MGRARRLIECCGDRLDIYSGDDATAMELMLLGGKGNVSVTANVAPQAMHDMCAAALAGDRETASAINAPLEGLHERLFVESNPIPVKWALSEMGLIPAGIRLPLTSLASEYHATVRQALRQAGIIE
jgi:4-hydroxy-tetrahydrodipicolinate synthase